MSAPEIRPGDVVVFKSGSPRMTVMGLRAEEGSVNLTWFDLCNSQYYTSATAPELRHARWWEGRW